MSDQLDWNTAMLRLRESLPQTQFQNWFQPISFIRHNKDSITLGVPSRFHQEWLRNHYQNQIQNIIEEQCGEKLELEFEILREQLDKKNTPLLEIDLNLKKEENREQSWDRNKKENDAVASVRKSNKPFLRIVEQSEKLACAAQHRSDSFYCAKPQENESELRIPEFGHDFVLLKSNQFAYQLIHLLLNVETSWTNPFLVLGGVGMGKTHLLAFFAKKLREKGSYKKICYTSSESFTSEMIRSIRSNEMQDFKNKYIYDIDLLLFDDVQVLSGREKTQEILLHIFNEITNRGGKIIFTSAEHPQNLKNFISPLKSRIQASIAAEIGVMSFDEKIELLNRVSEFHKFEIDPSLVQEIASKGHNDTRELVANLFQVHLRSKLHNHSNSTSRSLVSSDYISYENSISMDDLIGIVENTFQIHRAEMVSKSRKGKTVWARQVTMYLARLYTNLPLDEIGKTFNKDHATVIHAFQRVKETIENQPTYKYQIEYIKTKLQMKSPVINRPEKKRQQIYLVKEKKAVRSIPYTMVAMTQELPGME